MGLKSHFFCPIWLKIGLWVCLSMNNGQNKLQTIFLKNVVTMGNMDPKWTLKRKCGQISGFYGII